jgi:enediyne biosynthesis protein E4
MTGCRYSKFNKVMNFSKMKTLFCFCLLYIMLLSCGRFSGGNFRKLSPSRTGIHFLNELIENDTLNYTKFPYMYMGGGVSIGDINNDGLDDIFFTGNLVPNKLYLNKGHMKFEDISSAAGITGNHQWFTGSTMADVNNDGWLDIYVCVSAKYQPSDNLLFINNHDNTFTESAKAYGINDKSSSVQATFFDYNNDGLLDLYVANYPIVLVSQGAEFYRDKIKENKYEESGHLYRNDGNLTFTDVTDTAGVRNFGMSIGVVAADFNNDGWKDLYVSNDFNPPDFLYLNKGDGTFSESLKECTFQTSIFGMGIDAADINNDGLLDLFQIDMTPPGHYRRTVNVIPMRQETFDNSLTYGFHYQYMQNSLQLNNGVFDNKPVFSNIALMAGTAYTDWSWGGLFIDMDNDGLRDLFVSNGVLKDINNQDILASPGSEMYFRKQKAEYRPELFPCTPVPNFAFRNNGDLTFSNKSLPWGFEEPTLTNGISFSDLDNDGDLDLVMSNVNKVSAVYENRVAGKDNHYLEIKLIGPVHNPFGLGGIVFARTGKVSQKQELTLTRGYQSSLPPVIHFGLGKNQVIDEIRVIWPDGREQSLQNIKADMMISLRYEDAAKGDSMPATIPGFRDITAVSGIDFVHREDNFDDFKSESLLPYRISRQGPALAAGDVNGDGLEDFFVGNGSGFEAACYIQTKRGAFEKLDGPWVTDSKFEDTGAMMFDADGDNRTDIYVVSGGNKIRNEDEYNDRLYLNTTRGFIKSNALPAIKKSGKCVCAADIDGDGDMDLFAGGRLIPGKYPQPASSYILRNNGLKNGQLKFEDVTADVAPGLMNAGLVTDAMWIDFDEDGDTDLIIVGEWMRIRFFENNSGKFTEVTDKLGFHNTTGWWNSIHGTDVDQDGDIDFIAGNLGLNYKYRSDQSFEIFSNDFDLNGRNDIVLAFQENGVRYPANGFDATVGQIPVIGQRYLTFDAFAKATLEDIYGKKILDASLSYKVNTFGSVWIENKGKGKFLIHDLSNRAQLSSINDIADISFMGKSFVIGGNLYNSEVQTPRNDASVGLVMKYDKDSGMYAVPPSESGLMVKGQVSHILQIKLATGKNALVFGINGEALKLIEIE